MSTLSPIVKWSGGKKEEIKLFKQHIPNDIDTYIETFAGGAALFFHLKHNKNVINDVHTELTDFYNSIKNGHNQDIHDFMSQHPNEEKTYYKVRDELPINTPLDNAKRFYYLRKTCFRGMLRYNKKGKFNIPYGRYKTFKYDEILNPEYENLLKNTTVHNEDFEFIFHTYNDPKNFMFIDQPYDSEFTDYGYCKFDRDDQIRLAECFKNTSIRCLMVVGKTPFIEELYKGYIVEEYDKKYRFKLHSGRVGDEIDNKHLVIKNY